MFCKNCGCKLQEGDAFCSNCGSKVDLNEGNNIACGINTMSVSLNKLPIVTFFCNYIKKPVSYFEKYIGEDSIKISIPLLIILPMLYGLINMLYNTCIVKAVIDIIQDIPEFLAKMGIISSQDVIRAKNEMIMSDSWLTIGDKLNSLINKKDIFLSGFGNLLMIMIVTIVFIAILNAVMLKNKLNARDILLISTSSYIPLVISLIAGSIGTLLSILFGGCLILSGYILSFITLYNGIKDLSGERKDIVFLVMTILFIIASAVISFVAIMEIQSSMITIGKAFNAVKGFL